MPEDVGAEERIPALLREWGAVEHLPGAAEAQKEIEAELKALGWKGDPAAAVAQMNLGGSEVAPAEETEGPFETTEPEEMETTDQPKTRRTKT